MPLLWKKLFLASALAVGLGLTAACSSDDNPNSPTNPGNPSPSNPGPDKPGAPRIVSLSPNTPTSSSSAQTITVTGDRFASGLTVLLDAPNGVWTTYSGSAINVQSATSFTATVVLNRVGVWDITVHSPDGSESNEVQFYVQ
jgi:hypothetical protein